MKIVNDFIGGNNRIKILSNDGNPYPIPEAWGGVFTDCDILVAIPDMHMYIHDSPLDNFKYGADAMLSFLHHLESRKFLLEQDKKKLRIYQLGDFYEQRFPGGSRSGGNATAPEIQMSYPKYTRITNMLDSMRTHHLYGNHDFELRHFPGFRYTATEGKVYLEHGFTADTAMDFSNPDAPLWEIGQVGFQELRKVEEIFAKQMVDMGLIGKDKFVGLGVKSGKTPEYSYDATGSYESEEKFGKYIAHYGYAMKQPEKAGAKICVIGHTHQPYLKTDLNGGEHIFIDAGAWTVGRSDFAVITNEEVAICCYHRE
jgi:UDP-2,3-diacylglucosamine pyrophosphatase LpxH